ncbi:polysaccharide deacetylase family protein [Geodermatophilus sp. SYSU D01045]
MTAVEQGPLLVVNVHGIGPEPPDVTPEERDYWVSTDEFETLLDSLDTAGLPVVLTVDDGFLSDVTIALPRLVERGLTAAFFPCAGWLERPGRVGVDGVRELVAAGMPVGTHGWCHRDWRRLRPDEVDEEFRRSAEVLADASGHPITEAAIPFGRYDRVVLAHLRRAGYERVYTSDGGLADLRRWRVARTSVRPGVDRDWLPRLAAEAQQPRRRARDLAARVVKGRRRGQAPATP